ncbi:mucin-associated surface protein (MASP), putative, partial [Trypanosoma cruzi marinkellei]
MAMMMTGRVLLVCALCVLWCGAVFGDAGDDCWGEGGENVMRHSNDGGSDGMSLKVDCGLSFTRMGLMRAIEAGADDVKVDAKAASETLGASSSGSAPGGTGGGDAPGGKGGDAATPSPGPAAEGPTTLLTPSAEKPPASPPLEVGKGLATVPKTNKQTQDPNASPRNEEIVSEVTVPMQEPQSSQEKKKPKEDSREEENELTKFNEQHGTPNFHGESTETPSSAASDGVSSVAGRGTEEGIPNKTPQSEAAGKGGGKQAGNKNDATGEIPAETKGVNATAVIGNGERSPAAVTAATPDVGTESKPTTNDLRPPSTEGATQVSTTPDG